MHKFFLKTAHPLPSLCDLHNLTRRFVLHMYNTISLCIRDLIIFDSLTQWRVQSFANRVGEVMIQIFPHPIRF